MAIPSSFDIIGDIAIIDKGNKRLAKELLDARKNINVVLEKAGEVKTEFRVRKYKVLAKRKGAREFPTVPKSFRPEKTTETVHQESGCRFKIDPTKAYFSVRLGTERMRIAEMVKKNEAVLVMFAGVGPYPIVIAKHSNAKAVYAIELNPEAFKLMQQNIAINKVANVFAIKGNAKSEAMKLDTSFDRIIMPLPKESDLYLEVAIKKLKSSGCLHLYKILHENDLEEFMQFLKKEIKNYGQRVAIDVVKAGEYAPESYRYCFDIKCLK